MTQHIGRTQRAYQHLRTTNDTNGNPRRLWAVYERGEDPYPYWSLVAIHEDGYHGRPQHLDPHDELMAVDISPGEYRHIRSVAKERGFYHA